MRLEEKKYIFSNNICVQFMSIILYTHAYPDHSDTNNITIITLAIKKGKEKKS